MSEGSVVPAAGSSDQGYSHALGTLDRRNWFGRDIGDDQRSPIVRWAEISGLEGSMGRVLLSSIVGQRSRPGVRRLGPDQTLGTGQQAPLTPEYQAVLEASLADQAKGGLGNFPTTLGRAGGMPNMMMGFGPQEYVITPYTTYILIGWHDHYRRIFTDGRDFPTEIVPTYSATDGSTRTATASTTYTKLKRAVSRGPGPTRKPACLYTSTISLSSRSASTATRWIRISFMTKSHRSTML